MGKKISELLAYEIMGVFDKNEIRNVVTCMKPYETCAEAKARQKDLPVEQLVISKKSEGKILPEKPTEVVSLDISTIKAPADVKVKVTKPNWRLTPIL